MNRRTILKPVVAMFLAFALLLTGVVPGTLVTANAAEGYYLKYEYVDADGTTKESEPITDKGTIEVKQGTKGNFYLYKNDNKVDFEVYDAGRPVKVDDQGRLYNAYDFVQTSKPYVELGDKADEDAYIAIYFTLKVVVDTTDLDSIIATAEELKQDSYSPEIWAGFESALNNAKSWKEKINEDQNKKYQVAENEVKQQNINDAAASLNTAILNLKKEDLNTAIAVAETITNDNYTDASWTAFETVVNAAKELQAKEDVTAAEIEDAINAINTAKDALEKKLVVPTEKKDETTTSKKNETTTAKKNETKPAKKYTVSKTTLKKVKKSGKKAQLTWKKVKAATGYEVYQAVKKNGKYKKVKTIKRNKVVTYKTKSLKKKTYFFKVRTYRKVAGKTVYGAFSNVKKVTIK